MTLGIKGTLKKQSTECRTQCNTYYFEAIRRVVFLDSAAFCGFLCFHNVLENIPGKRHIPVPSPLFFSHIIQILTMRTDWGLTFNCS